MDEAYKEAQLQKVHQEQSVRAYDSVGSGFEQIVEEFGRMKLELENKQWALAEFDKNQGGGHTTG